MKMVSIGTKIKQIEGLHDTPDLTTWENDFVESIVTRTNHGERTDGLSEKQIDNVERIWGKHFA